MIIDKVYMKLKNKQKYKLNIRVSELVSITTITNEFLLENPEIEKEEIAGININIRFF